MVPPPPLSADPEFRPAQAERTLPPVVHAGAYRRVLANPFLGILGVALWVAAVRWALIASTDEPGVLVPALALLLPMAWFLPRLFHYHCLDCGRTGRLTRWKRHVCPAVAWRIVQGRPRRVRGPGPLAQTILWVYVLAAVLVLARLAGVTSR